MPSSSTSKHKIIDIDIYAQAILEGAGDGLVHLVETFSHPIDNIVVPVSLLLFDAAVVLSEQDITPEFNGYLKTNSAIVTDSRRRMNERIDAIQNLGDEFMQAEAPEKTRMASEILTNILVPGYVFNGIKMLSLAARNKRNFGSWSMPPLYKNVDHDGALFQPSSLPIRHRTPQEIQGMPGKHSFFYVITQDQELFLADPLLRKPAHGFKYLAHPELAQLKDVFAAGELYTNNGIITKIDNFSGHYRPLGNVGPMVEKFFNARGMEATGKFEPYIFNPSMIDPMLRPLMVFPTKTTLKPSTLSTFIFSLTTASYLSSDAYEVKTHLSESISSNLYHQFDLEHRPQGLTPQNAYLQIKDSILDPSLAATIKKEYTDALFSVSSQYFSDLSSQIEQIQFSTENTSPNQINLLEEIRKSIKTLSEPVLVEQDETVDLSIQLNGQYQKLDQRVSLAAQEIAECKKRIGKLNINQNKLFNHQVQFSENLHHMNQMMELIFDAHSTIDIRGVEDVPHIKQLHQELTHLKARQANGENLTGDISLKARELQKEKTQKISERIEFTENVQQKGKTLLGIAKMINLFGEEELAHQISTTTVAAMTIMEQGGALLGIGLAASAINPIFALASIGEAVFSVIGLFKRRPSGTPPHIVILRALQKLFEHVERLREEMHEEFDNLSAQLNLQHWQLIDKFSELKQSQRDTLSLLRMVYLESQQHHQEQNTRLMQLSQMLFSIETKMDGLPYSNDLQELKKHARFILQNTLFDQNYNELSNVLDDLGLERSLHHQQKSVLHVADEDSPNSYWQLASTILGLVNQHKKVVNRTEIQSPLSVIYACINNLWLSFKSYPIPNAPQISQHIAMRDINRFKDYENVLKSIEQVMMSARNPELIQFYVLQYESAVKYLAQTLEKTTNEIELQYTKQARINLDEFKSKLDGEERNQFNTEFEVGTYGWFLGTHHHEKRWHAGRNWYWPHETNSYEETSSKLKYINEKKQRLAQDRKYWNTKLDEQMMSSIENKLSIFKSTSVSKFHGARYLKPRESNLPYLPAPNPLLPDGHLSLHIMQALQEAQTLGIGYIKMFYDVSSNNSLFAIDIEFHLSPPHNLNPDLPTQLSILSFTLPYAPTFYQPAEAIWKYWLGGNWIAHQIGKTKQWHTGVTGVEALRGGGYGHKNGEYERNEWTITIPEQSDEIQGILEQFNAITDYNLTIHDEHVRLLKQASTHALQQLKQRYREKLNPHLDITSHDEVGRACALYEEVYRNLFGLLSYAHHDVMQDLTSPLRSWFTNHPVNIQALKRSANDRALTVHLNDFIQALPELKQHITAIHSQDLGYTLLIETKIALETFLMLYTPHAIEHNTHFPSIHFNEEVKDALAETSAIFAEAFLHAIPSEMVMKTIETRLKRYSPMVVDEVTQRLNLKLQDRSINALPTTQRGLMVEDKKINKVAEPPLNKEQEQSRLLPSKESVPVNTILLLHPEKDTVSWPCTPDPTSSDKAICVAPDETGRYRELHKMVAKSFNEVDQHIKSCETLVDGKIYCKGDEIEYIEHPAQNTMMETPSTMSVLGSAAINGAMMAALPEAIGDLFLLSGRVSEKRASDIKWMTNTSFMLLTGSWMGAAAGWAATHTLKQVGVSSSNARVAGNAVGFFVNTGKNLTTPIGAASTAIQFFSARVGLWAEKKAFESIVAIQGDTPKDAHQKQQVNN